MCLVTTVERAVPRALDSRSARNRLRSQTQTDSANRSASRRAAGPAGAKRTGGAKWRIRHSAIPNSRLNYPEDDVQVVKLNFNFGRFLSVHCGRKITKIVHSWNFYHSRELVERNLRDAGVRRCKLTKSGLIVIFLEGLLECPNSRRRHGKKGHR